VTTLLQHVDRWRSNPLFGQMLRFGIAGGLSTVLYSAVYLPLTLYVFERQHAVYAVPFAFAVAVTAGFFLHSRWSFKGHGTGARGAAQQVQFVLVQASGMALNALITWIGTAKLGYPGWVPLLPAIVLATGMTFVLNRYLVFK
jgi:putative flippase GtrA